MGFRQTLKSLGQRVSPWGRPLRNLIDSDISRPCFLVATTIVLRLLLNFSTVLDNQTENQCRIIISYNQPWSIESYAFMTSIYAMLRLPFCRRQSKVTVLSICKLSVVPLHPGPAPLWAPSIKPYVSRCSVIGPNKYQVNYLYKVFKQVIGLWFSLVNSLAFWSSVVLPSENQAEYSILVSNEDMILALAGQFKQLSHEPEKFR